MGNYLKKALFLSLVLGIGVVSKANAIGIIHQDNFDAGITDYSYFGTEKTGESSAADSYGAGNVVKIDFDMEPFNPPSYTPYVSWLMLRNAFASPIDVSAPNTYIWFDIYSTLASDLTGTLAVKLVDADGDEFRVPNSKLETIPQTGSKSKIIFSVEDFTLEDEDTPAGDGILDLTQITRWLVFSLRVDAGIQALDLPPSSVYIDDITAETIPEPTTLALFGLGVLGILRRKMKK